MWLLKTLAVDLWPVHPHILTCSRARVHLCIHPQAIQIHHTTHSHKSQDPNPTNQPVVLNTQSISHLQLRMRNQKHTKNQAPGVNNSKLATSFLRCILSFITRFWICVEGMCAEDVCICECRCACGVQKRPEIHCGEAPNVSAEN